MATIEKYQTRSGATLYRVRYRKPDRKQTQKRGFTTKREAEMFAATVEVAKARGEYVAPSVGRTTIGELGPAWLSRQRGHLKAASIAGQESSWRTHVQPRWAAARIGDIRHSDVQAWVAELSGRRGPDCVRAAVRIHGIVTGVSYQRDTQQPRPVRRRENRHERWRDLEIRFGDPPEHHPILNRVDLRELFGYLGGHFAPVRGERPDVACIVEQGVQRQAKLVVT